MQILGSHLQLARKFGDDGYHVDHWKPISRGGTNDPSNLKLLHPVCNLKKGARDPTTDDETDPLVR